jgi:hypothetical protein
VTPSTQHQTRLKARRCCDVSTLRGAPCADRGPEKTTPSPRGHVTCKEKRSRSRRHSVHGSAHAGDPSAVNRHVVTCPPSCFLTQPTIRCLGIPFLCARSSHWSSKRRSASGGWVIIMLLGAWRQCHWRIVKGTISAQVAVRHTQPCNLSSNRRVIAHHAQQSRIACLGATGRQAPSAGLLLSTRHKPAQHLCVLDTPSSLGRSRGEMPSRQLSLFLCFSLFALFTRVGAHNGDRMVGQAQAATCCINGLTGIVVRCPSHLCQCVSPGEHVRAQSTEFCLPDYLLEKR